MTQQHFQMQVPEALVGGVLADFVGVGHNAHYFTLDFAAVSRTEHSGPDAVDVFAQVVARVKILPPQVFEIMKALEQQLSQWEAETGARPGGPEAPGPS